MARHPSTNRQWALPWFRGQVYDAAKARASAIRIGSSLYHPRRSLARLFELGGNTIWPLALLHFTVQGAVKILEVPGDTVMPLVWISTNALIPYSPSILTARSANGLIRLLGGRQNLPLKPRACFGTR
jgi:hypothetical protein